MHLDLYTSSTASLRYKRPPSKRPKIHLNHRVARLGVSQKFVLAQLVNGAVVLLEQNERQELQLTDSIGMALFTKGEKLSLVTSIVLIDDRREIVVLGEGEKLSVCETKLLLVSEFKSLLSSPQVLLRFRRARIREMFSQ